MLPTWQSCKLVADELGLHTLAVEDAITGRQRPKFSRYTGHDFLTAYAVRLDRETGSWSPAKSQPSSPPPHWSPSARTTSSPSRDCSRWDDNAHLTKYGVGSLVHGLLDHLVDGHFDAVQSLDDEIDQLEDLLFDDRRPDKDVQRRSYELRKSLVHLRRVVLPMREVLNTLMRRDVGLRARGDGARLPRRLRPCPAGHRVDREPARPGRHHCGNQPDHPGNRLNIITKKVTSWAAIIAVPTAITGFYGQNLPYPGFSQESGFIASSVLIVALSGGLYLAFKRKDWL